MDKIFQKRPTILGFATGGVAGLVGITPAAGFVGLSGALIIGLAAGAICFCMVVFVKNRLGYDDSLDAFGVHGVAGVVGIIGTGLFANPAITKGFALGGDAGIAGLFYGNPGLIGVQVVGILITIGLAFGGTLGLFWLIDLVRGVRVSEKEEAIGLDITQHNERAYTIIE
jgi:Amt family ammonium transporter